MDPKRPYFHPRLTVLNLRYLNILCHFFMKWIWLVPSQLRMPDTLPSVVKRNISYAYETLIHIHMYILNLDSSVLIHTFLHIKLRTSCRTSGRVHLTQKVYRGGDYLPGIAIHLTLMTRGAAPHPAPLKLVASRGGKAIRVCCCGRDN
jgi:hypothetical protein